MATSAWREVSQQTSGGATPSPGDTDLSRIEFYEDFESGSNGQAVENFTDLVAADNGTCDTSESYSGSRCMRTFITGGQEGYGDWGFRYYPGAKAGRGGQVWVRIAAKYPSDFNYSASPRLKCLRWHRRRITSSGGDVNAYYIDAYLKQNGWSVIVEDTWTKYYNPSGGNWVEINEGGPGTGANWHLFEMAVGLDHRSVGDGGAGYIRMWTDGQLIANIDRVTMDQSIPSTADSFLWHTYWNGNAPKTQHHWVDSVAIAVQGGGRNDLEHLDVDSNGYPYIGTAT